MITKTIERCNAVTEAWEDITASCQEPLTITERRDRELDDGDFLFCEFNNTTSKAVEPYTLFRVTLNDGVNTPVTAYFNGAGQRAMLRNKWGNGAGNSQKALFRHAVALAEKTKDTQGVLIDGFAVTQDVNESVTLKDVADRLFAVTPVKAVGDTVTEQYALTDDERVLSVLRNTKAPEYKWNCQSTLWECLCDIGDTIGAIPRVELEEYTPTPSPLLINVWLEGSGASRNATRVQVDNYNGYPVILHWEARDRDTAEVLESGTVTEEIPSGTLTKTAQNIEEFFGQDFARYIAQGYIECDFVFICESADGETSVISKMGEGGNSYHT